MRMEQVAAVVGAMLLLVGCGAKKEPAVQAFRLQPYPVAVRSDSVPFGLYATPPDLDTMEALKSSLLSPDGRFQTARTAQGLWVKRVDDAWCWQIDPKPGASQFIWTTRGTLLFSNEAGVWQEADPLAALVRPLLGDELKGKAILSFSPDGREVVYSVPGPKGPVIWLSGRDGKNPKRLGENVRVDWKPDGTPLVSAVQAAPQPLRRPGSDPSMLAR